MIAPTHPLWSFARAMWPFAKTIAGDVAAIVTFGYMGIKAVLEFINWYREKFWDSKVQDFLESQIVRLGLIGPIGVRPQSASAKSIPEIVEMTGLTAKRVDGCLKRLKRRRLVTQERPGYWRADVPAHAPQ